MCKRRQILIRRHELLSCSFSPGRTHITVATRFKHKAGQYRLAFKGALLLILPLPLLAAAIVALAKGNLVRVGVDAGAFSLLLFGALLARRGLVNEADYNRRKVVRAPLPFKAAGALAIAVATFVAAWLAARYSLTVALCFGIGAFVGFWLAYGFDPDKEKTVVTGAGITTEEVIEALTEAERKLENIEASTREIRSGELKSRLRRICEQARSILAVIEEDPRDLRRARKFLHVYLDGAERVSKGYARTSRQGTEDKLKDNFRNVLETIEQVFKEQHEKLLENDVLDLDVQIEVLSTQLKREGVI